MASKRKLLREKRNVQPIIPSDLREKPRRSGEFKRSRRLASADFLTFPFGLALAGWQSRMDDMLRNTWRVICAVREGDPVWAPRQGAAS